MHMPPPRQGLYPQFEHEACGVGFLVNINKSHTIVDNRSGCF